MCFDTDSFPPVPVIAGASVDHEDLVLEAEDGTRFAAFLASADEASDVGVLVLPDVRGLYRFYEELALRFAERGYHALAVDYFGRTAGVDKRPNDWEFRPHVDATTPEGLRADAAAAVARLREAGATTIVTVGFCFGGRLSWTLAAQGLGLAGAVGFYGRPGDVPVEQIEVPILALQAGDDANITHEHNEEFRRRLEAAGVEHDVVEYEGAPHSFFDRKQDEYQDVSDDAWRRTLAFIERLG
jgi:carboxymethylenebutenolidase